MKQNNSKTSSLNCQVPSFEAETKATKALVEFIKALRKIRAMADEVTKANEEIERSSYEYSNN